MTGIIKAIWLEDKIKQRIDLHLWEKFVIEDYCSGDIDENGIDKGGNDFSQTRVFKLIKEFDTNEPTDY